MSFARGVIIFSAGESEKTVTFEEAFTSLPVIKLTANNNTSLYLSDVQNSFFVVQKNNDLELTVNYIAIESES
jgi:hypothetical protein